jgi:hypothetical protein
MEPTVNIDLSPRPRRASRLPAGLVVAAALAGLLVLPSVAHAQQVVVVDEVAYGGPRWGLIGSGLFVFAGTYTASFVVAATSSHAGDKALYAPLAGPWLDIATRCSDACNGEMGTKVLLGFDGVFQAIGALSVVSGFLMPRRRAQSVMAGGASGWSFHVMPASYGRAPGLAAVGTF